MYRARYLILYLFCIPSICLAQPIFFESPLSLLRFIEEHPADSVYLKGVDVQCQSPEWVLEHMYEAQEYLNEENKFVVSKNVFLDEVNFIEGTDAFFRFQNCVFQKNIKVETAQNSREVFLINCDFFGSAEIVDFNAHDALYCEKNTYHQNFFLYTNSYNVYIDECEFLPDTSKSWVPTSYLDFEENTQMILIKRSKFSGQSLRIYSLGTDANIVLKENQFDHDLDLSNNRFGELSIRDSKLVGKLSMNRTEFDVFRSYIPVNFFHKKLFIRELIVDGHIFSSADYSETTLDYSNKYYVEQFLSVYRKFENFYDTKGNIEDKNIVTVRFHELNLQRKLYALRSDFSVYGAIDYMIRNFIGITTEFGTNPIRIINLSFATVFVFSLIFLLDRIKQKRKTTTGSSMNFSIIFGLIMLSILYSLNSFTTLGFGELPKKKTTAYIAVVEGFIGWLALTLFSVCLVTQFLA